MKDLKAVDSVQVRRGEQEVGALRRTKLGAVFEYSTENLESLGGNAPGIAFSLTYPPRIHEITGTNLHPFFAGLLPEGLRLSSLIKGMKTSPDDLYTLLLGAGNDTIGDVFINAGNATEKIEAGEIEAEVEISKPEKLDFGVILERELKRSTKESFKSSLPGVQNKLSASMISLPLRGSQAKKHFILKLTPPQYPALVANEYHFLAIAKSCGIEVNHAQLVTDCHGEQGLLVTRFDRVYSAKTKTFSRLHLEDACQFLGKYPSEKYRLNHREIAEGIQELSSVPAIDLLSYLRLICFSYLIGNGDLHGKNVSLIVDSENLTRLSPAYDLLSTVPYGDEKLALKFEGRDDNLKRKDFLNFAKRHRIQEKACSKMLEELSDVIEQSLDQIEKIGLPSKKTEYLKKVIAKRISEVRVS